MVPRSKIPSITLTAFAEGTDDIPRTLREVTPAICHCLSKDVLIFFHECVCRVLVTAKHYE
jgi:hypothetical protein